MAKGRHKKKKPLVYRLAPGVFTLALAGGVGYHAVDLDDERRTPQVSASQTSLPRLPSARDADFQETDRDLCSSFVALGVRCNVRYALDEDTKVGELLTQVPEAGSLSDQVTLTYSKGPALVVAPILSGLSKEEAVEILWRAGFALGEEDTQDAPAEKGTVVSTSLEPSSKSRNGTRIDLTYSSGLVKVPDWLGKPKELVEAQASEFGLTVRFKEEESSDVTPGLVIKQESANKRVSFRKVINLIVATAGEGKSELPDVVGMKQEEAIALLASSGFVKITTIVNSDDEAARVISMTPGPGEKSRLEDEVVLVVNVSR